MEGNRVKDPTSDIKGDPYFKYVSMFDKFFQTATLVATYKPMFVRALADIGKYGDEELIGKEWISLEGGHVRLKLDFVAVRMAKYYWDMEIAFGMRHIPKRMADHNMPDKDINMVRLVREQVRQERREAAKKSIDEMDDETMNVPSRVGGHVSEALGNLTPPTLKVLASDQMEDFRTKVIQEGMVEVLRKIPNDMPELYVRKGRYITLESDVIDFMRISASALKKASCFMLAIKFEHTNPEMGLVATMTNEKENTEKLLEEIQRLQVKAKRDNTHSMEEQSELDKPRRPLAKKH